MDEQDLKGLFERLDAIKIFLGKIAEGQDAVAEAVKAVADAVERIS